MRLTYFFTIILVLVISSCEYDSQFQQYNLGDDFIDDPTNVLLVDTLTVNTFTMASDSFKTSQNERLLFGNYQSEYGINTYAEAYFKFDPTVREYFHPSAEYDSIGLILHFDGYKYGDTTQVSEFEIYRLSEAILPDSETGSIYNTQQLMHEDLPMGSFSVDFSDRTDSVFIRLSDTLGMDFFNMAESGSDYMSNSLLFDTYFKGVVLKPVAGGASVILGLNAVVDSLAAPKLRVYYHDNGVNDNLSFDMPMDLFEYTANVNSPSRFNYYAFSHVLNDYSGTVLEGIDGAKDEISSSASNNVTFLQGGSILQTRIEIPYIDNLYQYGLGSILKAELYIEPIDDSFDERSDLPQNLRINLVDDKLRLFEPLYVAGTETPALGQLNFNKQFEEKTHYTYDITNYVKTEYEEVADLSYTMVMFAPFRQEKPNVDLLVVGDTKNTAARLKLKVYLTKF